MKLTLQVMISTEDGQQTAQEIIVLQRDGLQPETLGLTVAESKTLLRSLQQVMVEQQGQEFIDTHRQCPQCGRAYHHKDSQTISVRTVFGKVTVESPVSITVPVSRMRSGRLARWPRNYRHERHQSYSIWRQNSHPCSRTVSRRNC